MKRQANALTAVLENWQDVENAIDIYANSAGSALRENEIYLDSWEAKSKAVSAAWNELVNSLLDSNWIKGFLDGAQNVLSWLTNTNALIPVLAGLIGGVLTLAIQGLVKWIQGLKVALTEVNLLAGGIPLLIGLITTLAVGVVTWGINASDTAKQIENLTNKIEEQQKAIDDLNAKEKEATDLYKEYASLMSKSNAYGLSTEEKENLLKISNQLVDTYGLEVQGIDAVTGAYVIGTSAINDYVEALRAERLEKQKEQTDTRNKRIKKNIKNLKDPQYDLDYLKNAQKLLEQDEVKSLVSEYIGKYKAAKNVGEQENLRLELSRLLWDKAKEYNALYGWDISDQESNYAAYNALGVAYGYLGYVDIDSEVAKLTSKTNSIINSIIKDVITNIQVENADTMTQSGESVLTSMLQSILPNIEDLDEDKVKEIQDKVNEFTGTYGYVFDELGLKNKQIQEQINSNTVSIKDYKELLDNQMKQLQVVEQIFGATSEEANAFREQLDKSIENNTGLYFANISKTMSESDLDTSEFDKVTSAILKLDGAMANGEITFSEYVDELNKNLDNISLESTFQGDENAAKSFFAVLNDKGKKAIQNLMAQYQNGEISQKDYLSGIADMVDYFENLSDQATLMLGVDSSELSETIDGLKEAQNELNNFKSVVQTIPDTFEEFKNGGVSSVSALTSALEKAGITSMEIGGKVRNTSKEIAQAMQENAENFAEAKEKIADDFRKNLTTIGKNLATAVNKMIEIFGKVDIVLDPPDVSLWDWLKAMFTGKTEEMVFGVRIGSEADPESWGKHFGDLAEELDWGFDDFTGGGGGDPPPNIPPGGGDKDKDKPDYEDSTDAIINRINLRAKELEQQEKSIENAIEIAKLEEDHEKQISLTNDLIANRRQRIEELNKANAELHNNAENLRNANPWDEDSWVDSQGNATEAYYNDLNSAATKEEQEKIKELFEQITKYQKSYRDNTEEINDLNKEILESERDIADLLEDMLDEATDFGSSYLDSKKSLLESYYDVTNAVVEAQHELNKELKASKTMYEYLDEDTRKLLFNQEDYNKLSEELYDIQHKADKLKRQYTYDLENATLNTIEEITSNYEMQYEMLMKSYEIAKADLEVAKKKQKLNNVLNERNVRMFVNGQWQWVANTQDVIDAQNELADAEYEAQQARLEKEQTDSINNLTKQQDELTTIINEFEDGVIDLDTAVYRITEMFSELPIAMQQAINKIKSINANKTSSGGGSSFGGNNATAFIPGIGTKPIHIDQNGRTTTKGLPVGTIVHTGGGDFEITGGDGGNYTSKPVDKEYATGTRRTIAGNVLMGEDGSEMFISANGHLIPINQPTIANVDAGGIVFNQDQMSNLRSLWDLSNITRPVGSIVNNSPQKTEQTIDNRIIINGMTVDSGSSDGKALISALRRYVGNH